MLKVEHPKKGGNSEVVDLLKEEQRIEQQAWKRKSILKRLKRSDSDSNSQGLQTGEPISIFQEITKAEDQSKKQNLEGLLNKLGTSYSDDLKIGVSLKTGDCFFDSVAQGLNELKDKGLVENSERFNVKSLRKDCADYARENNSKDSSIYKKVIKDAEDYFVPQKNVVFPHLANIKDKKGNDAPDVQETFNKYLDYIKNVATENGPIPIWGRPEIEGQMISNKYDVMLYFYSTNEENGQKITVTKITPGSDDPEIFIEGENLDQLHTDSNKKVVRIVNYKKHFVPLLSNLEADITKGVKVSREEVYGIENKKSSSLIEDIGNYDLEENNDPNISGQVERSFSTRDTDDNINTGYKYADHMILKVWYNFISKKGLKFYVGKNHDDSGERYEESLFQGNDKIALAIKAGLLINNSREIYRNSGGYSVSMCQAVDYIDNSRITGENSISNSVKDALNQINLWNQQHQNQITKHKILSPYHSGPDHWILGVITLEYEQGVLKDSQLEIYDPMGTGSICENVKSELKKVLNDNGGHIELRFIDKSEKQQNDGTSCGAITAENGKDIIEGKSDRLKKTYESGAYELRKQHVEEVNNILFTEIQSDNATYGAKKTKIFDNIEGITNNFHIFLNNLSDQDYNEFKNVLEKLKQDDYNDSPARDISGIFSKYKVNLKASKVFDWFFSDDLQGLKWKDNALDNLKYLIERKNLFDSFNRKAHYSNSGNRHHESTEHSSAQQENQQSSSDDSQSGLGKKQEPKSVLSRNSPLAQPSQPLVGKAKGSGDRPEKGSSIQASQVAG